MGRKVSVGLEADVAGFLGPVLESVKATEKLDDKIEDLDHSLNKIPADAAKAGLAMKLLGGDVDSVGDKIGSLGEKNTGLAVLDAKLREAQKEVRKLGDEFVRTGDIDVFGKLGEAEAKLRGLRDARKTLADSVVEGADKADIALKKLGDAADGTSKKINAVGNPAGSAALTVLDARIRSWQQEVRKLGDEFSRTGDIDVFRKLGDAQARLGGMKDVRKHLTTSLTEGTEDAGKIIANVLAKSGFEAADGFSKTFTSSLSGFLSTPVLGPILIGLAAAVAAPLAAFVGSAIGGAVSLAGAGAGAGLGLAGAWMGDPQKYQGMWNKAIDGIQGRWMASSAAFGNELEGALKVVDRMLQDLPVEKVLALSQSFVMPLAEGAGGGITAAANGFADLLAAAQPVVDTIGPKLEGLGHSVGDSMRAIGMGTEGGAEALGDLVDATGAVIQATGIMILGLEDAYHTMREGAKTFETNAKSIIDTFGGPGLGEALQNMGKNALGMQSTMITAGRTLYGVESAGHSAASGLAATAAEAAKASVEAMGLNDALTETRSTMIGMANANIALAQGWLDLKKGLEDGKRTLDMSTQAGIDNVTNIKDQIANAEALRQQQIKTGGGTAEAIATANAAYDANIEKIKQAAYAAHFNKDQVDALITSISGIPPAAETKITTPGMATALDQSASLGQRLNQIDREYIATIKVAGLAQVLADAARARAALSSIGGAGQSRGSDYHAGGIRRAQVGMILPPSDPGTVLAAEPQTGGEALIPFQGISQGRAMSLMQQVGSGYGLNVSAGGGHSEQTLRLIVQSTDGRVIRDTVIEWNASRGRRDPATFFLP